MIGCAKLKSPRKLVVMDTKPERLELAKKFGADLVLNPLNDDVVKIVKEMTGGYGCDVYIEATGHPNAVVQGLQMIRKLGRFVEFSVFAHDVTVDWALSPIASNWTFSAFTFDRTASVCHRRHSQGPNPNRGGRYPQVAPREIRGRIRHDEERGQVSQDPSDSVTSSSIHQ
jgi:threonine dehydrogenase-like Zn-dependent dehydrogenase